MFSEDFQEFPSLAAAAVIHRLLHHVVSVWMLACRDGIVQQMVNQNRNQLGQPGFQKPLDDSTAVLVPSHIRNTLPSSEPELLEDEDDMRRLQDRDQLLHHKIRVWAAYGLTNMSLQLRSNCRTFFLAAGVIKSSLKIAAALRIPSKIPNLLEPPAFWCVRKCRKCSRCQGMFRAFRHKVLRLGEVLVCPESVAQNRLYVLGQVL
mmetsp:Transcript_82740/g.146095  ORF Transcript_82740/g.146095 Transcript_82740/m.146095 type:complete len:205 (+) Transcript_82740:278-892(+)